ncbi:MAG: MFS transporter [Acidocella sp. 35-58-6]|jgi:Na+/melibiose symporter-like transporter|nr:MAG: MFS transporter [Acidocella sp. 20-58-15]OYY05763.1 MAG: MFS transporter [Acidocella sp. 35-58-6]
MSDQRAPAPLRWQTLLIYAAPAMPLGMLGLPLLVILPNFWAGPMGMNLATVGFVLTLVRVMDAVFDPTIGRLSDMSRSRFGRRKPFIAFAIPVAVVGAVGLFFPPLHAGAVWLFIFNALVTWGWTMISLPYWAWGAELSDEYKERQRITSFREGGTIIGILISALAPVVLGITSPEGEAHLLVILTIGLATPFVLAALIMVPDPLPTQLEKPAGLAAALKVAAANAPFRKLIFAWLINGLANGLPAVLFLMICTQYLNAPAAQGPLLLVYFASGVLAVPLWLWLAVRIGKHRAWITSLLVTAFAFSFVPLVPHIGLWFFGLISVFTGSGLGADFTIPPAIQADVVDLDELQSGERRAGLFFAASTMAQKAGNALAVGIAFPLLQLVGFTTHAANGPFQKAALLIMYCGVPSALKLICALILRGFPLGEPEQHRLRAEISLRQTKAA